MELQLIVPNTYRVKRGQTLAAVAKTFCVPPALLASCNGLKGELTEGQIITLPRERGNVYTVRGGESKSLLCGSPARFEKLNGTDKLFVGQTVYLG